MVFDDEIEEVVGTRLVEGCESGRWEGRDGAWVSCRCHSVKICVKCDRCYPLLFCFF